MFLADEKPLKKKKNFFKILKIDIEAFFLSFFIFVLTTGHPIQLTNLIVGM